MLLMPSIKFSPMVLLFMKSFPNSPTQLIASIKPSPHSLHATTGIYEVLWYMKSSPHCAHGIYKVFPPLAPHYSWLLWSLPLMLLTAYMKSSPHLPHCTHSACEIWLMAVISLPLTCPRTNAFYNSLLYLAHAKNGVYEICFTCLTLVMVLWTLLTLLTSSRKYFSFSPAAFRPLPYMMTMLFFFLSLPWSHQLMTSIKSFPFSPLTVSVLSSQRNRTHLLSQAMSVALCSWNTADPHFKK